MNPSETSTPVAAKGERTEDRPSFWARYFNPLRLSSYLFVVYAYGHTTGAVIKIPRFGPESDAVVSTMQTVHFRAQGADATWYGFYRGFGYWVGFSMLFFAYLAWLVGGMTNRTRAALLPVAWGLLVVHLAGIPLTLIYFFPSPIIFQSVIAVFLAVGCVLASRRARLDAAGLDQAP
jgi:hypothetical protein